MTHIVKWSVGASFFLLTLSITGGCNGDQGGSATGGNADGTTTTISGNLTRAGSTPISGATVYVADGSTGALRVSTLKASVQATSCSSGAVTCEDPPEASCAQTCSCADGSYTLDVSACSSAGTIQYCIGGACFSATVSCTSDSATCSADVVADNALTRIGSAGGTSHSTLVMGTGGRVYSTSDGVSFSALVSGTTQDLNDFCIHNTSDTAFYIVGNNGTVLKSTDAGVTLTSTGPTTTKNLYGCAFLDTQTGYVTASGGSVFKTIDGGAHWQEITGVGTAGTDLLAATFSDTDTGWVVGTGGAIYKTADGGANWTSQASGTTRTLRTIVPGESHVLVAGDGGVLLSTSDGGVTWTVGDSGTSADLRILGFIQLGGFRIMPIGFLFGNGFIGFTNDDGATWVNETPTDSLLGGYQSFYWGGAGGFLIVGDNDLILEMISGPDLNSSSPPSPFSFTYSQVTFP